MAKLLLVNGIQSNILRIKLLDSSATDGSGRTGLAWDTAGLVVSTLADVEATSVTYMSADTSIEDVTVLGTYAAPTAGKCRFAEVDPTYHPGVYELQVADARFAVANARSLLVSVFGPATTSQQDLEVQLYSATPPEVTVADDGITAAALAADTDTFQAKVWLFDDDAGTTDRYAVSWFRNGQPVLASITLPKIQVIKVADGTDLIAETAMTEIGALQMFKYSATTTARITSGAAYIAKVKATIDGSVRTWTQPVGRDSV